MTRLDLDMRSVVDPSARKMDLRVKEEVGRFLDQPLDDRSKSPSSFRRQIFSNLPRCLSSNDVSIKSGSSSDPLLQLLPEAEGDLPEVVTEVVVDEVDLEVLPVVVEVVWLVVKAGNTTTTEEVMLVPTRTVKRRLRRVGVPRKGVLNSLVSTVERTIWTQSQTSGSTPQTRDMPTFCFSKLLD